MAVTINGSGKLINNVVSATKTSKFTTTSTSYVAVTGLSATITPTSTSSKVLVNFDLNAGIIGNAGGVRIYRNGAAIAIGDANASDHRLTSNVYNGGDDSNSTPSWSMSVLDSPATTSAVTYQIYVACFQGGGTIVINDQTSQVTGQSYACRSASTITAMEVTG
jgi:hypothetical protein